MTEVHDWSLHANTETAVQHVARIQIHMYSLGKGALKLNSLKVSIWLETNNLSGHRSCVRCVDLQHESDAGSMCTQRGENEWRHSSRLKDRIHS